MSTQKRLLVDDAEVCSRLSGRGIPGIVCATGHPGTYYDGPAGTYINRAGEVIGRDLGEASRYVRGQILDVLELGDFVPAFLDGENVMVGGVRSPLRREEHLDLPSAERIREALKRLLGDVSIDIRDTRQRGWPAGDTIPCWTFYFENGAFLNAGQFATHLQSDNGGDLFRYLMAVLDVATCSNSS